MICNLGDPMSLRHPVMKRRERSCDFSMNNLTYSFVASLTYAWHDALRRWEGLIWVISTHMTWLIHVWHDLFICGLTYWRVTWQIEWMGGQEVQGALASEEGMYIHIYIYICSYIHIYIFILYIYMFIYTYIYIYIYIERGARALLCRRLASRGGQRPSV